MVLSGRIDHFGKAQRWQLTTKPFNTTDALAQLQEELQWLGAENPALADAQRLVTVLGGLPLAIHLAAGFETAS